MTPDRWRQTLTALTIALFAFGIVAAELATRTDPPAAVSRAGRWETRS